MVSLDQLVRLIHIHTNSAVLSHQGEHNCILCLVFLSLIKINNKFVAGSTLLATLARARECSSTCQNNIKLMNYCSWHLNNCLGHCLYIKAIIMSSFHSLATDNRVEIVAMQSTFVSCSVLLGYHHPEAVGQVDVIADAKVHCK